MPNEFNGANGAPGDMNHQPGSSSNYDAGPYANNGSNYESQYTHNPPAGYTPAEIASMPASHVAPAEGAVRTNGMPMQDPAYSTPGMPTGEPIPGYGAPNGNPMGQHAAPAGRGPAGPTGPRPGAPAATQPSSSNGTGKTFLFAFIGALLACLLVFGIMFGFGLIGGSKGSSNSVNIGSSTSNPITSSDVEATLAEAVAEKCLPSVVSIDVYAKQSSSSGNSIYDFLYGYGQNNSSDELAQAGLGSGVIVSSDGYIITNYHVVEGGEAYRVTIEGDVYDAEYIGADPSSDVAVLKTESSKKEDGGEFTAIEIGDSDNISIGEWVMTIGSPFGLEQSVATGIVSATSRSQIMDSSTDMFGNSTGETTIYPNMIQTDAAINPGNSGGALVDAEGALIGLNTLITSNSGNYSGVGFAIPSNYAISLAQSIIAGEEPSHAYLGITMTTISKSIAERYGFSADEGAYISSVINGSPAEKAGLEVGDIITSINGKDVSSASDVMLEIRTKKAGDTVTVTVDRNGEQQDVSVTLGESQGQSGGTTQNGLKGRSQG